MTGKNQTLNIDDSSVDSINNDGIYSTDDADGNTFYISNSAISGGYGAIEVRGNDGIISVSSSTLTGTGWQW
ncbi:hypothetical protein A3N65_12365 [Klebsiella aerogenes]|nr:hypothetical protein A3N65_12365 [Klebsiella aerogenes]